MSASVTLDEFAQLADVIDIARLPPGPADAEGTSLSMTN
jgi:hypothetical protein